MDMSGQGSMDRKPGQFMSNSSFSSFEAAVDQFYSAFYT